MKVATKIHMNKFKPRWYQEPLMDALENKGYKRILAILPRRARQRCGGLEFGH